MNLDTYQILPKCLVTKTEVQQLFSKMQSQDFCRKAEYGVRYLQRIHKSM